MPRVTHPCIRSPDSVVLAPSEPRWPLALDFLRVTSLRLPRPGAQRFSGVSVLILGPVKVIHRLARHIHASAAPTTLFSRLPTLGVEYAALQWHTPGKSFRELSTNLQTEYESEQN